LPPDFGMAQFFGALLDGCDGEPFMMTEIGAG
jgi:hypothetical protein